MLGTQKKPRSRRGQSYPIWSWDTREQQASHIGAIAGFRRRLRPIALGPRPIEKRPRFHAGHRPAVAGFRYVAAGRLLSASAMPLKLVIPAA
jgi:hypothetical protein